MPEKNLGKHFNRMEEQGYTLIGKALFRDEQEGPVEAKRFAASIGADLVEALIVPVGTMTQTRMGISSITPGRTVTGLTTSSGFATGNQSGVIQSPYGAIPFNAQGSATTSGTAITSAYIPGQVTYAPMSYDVLITDQIYLFWLSPAAFVRNWLDRSKTASPHLPPEQQITTEQAKQNAAMIAQAWNVPLPHSLRPKEPIPQLSAAERAETREMWLKLLREVKAKSGTN